jgi:hypothetical protein
MVAAAVAAAVPAVVPADLEVVVRVAAVSMAMAA